jgi:hypothetical protein
MTAGRKNLSNNQHWCTPHHYVIAIRDFLGHIALDPCSNEKSIVGAAREYRLPVDGLRESWDFKTIYVNPPYGADRDRGTTIKHWLARCAEANAKYGSEVVALVPVATNTSHWKDFVWGVARSVAFLYDTRLKFLVDGSNADKGAPMSCALVYWGDNGDGFDDAFSRFGAVVDLSPLRGREFGGRIRQQPQLFGSLEVEAGRGGRIGRLRRIG